MKFNSKLQSQPGSVDPICCGPFHGADPLQLIRASRAIIQIQDKHKNLKILLKQRCHLGRGQKGPGGRKTVNVTYFLEMWLPKSGGMEMPRAQTVGSQVWRFQALMIGAVFNQVKGQGSIYEGSEAPQASFCWPAEAELNLGFDYCRKESSKFKETNIIHQSVYQCVSSFLYMLSCSHFGLLRSVLVQQINAFSSFSFHFSVISKNISNTECIENPFDFPF